MQDSLRNIFEELAYSEKMEMVICDVWNTGSCKRYSDLEDQGKKVVKILQQYIPAFEKAVFLGNNKFPLTNFWREFSNDVKDHPKTDIKIGSYRISLKFKFKSLGKINPNLFVVFVMCQKTLWRHIKTLSGFPHKRNCCIF
jgi:hypothetical protein